MSENEYPPGFAPEPVDPKREAELRRRYDVLKAEADTLKKQQELSRELGVGATKNEQAEATLALAYEQRTANLIAVFGQLDPSDEEQTFLSERIDGCELAKRIQERLGL